MIQFVLGYVADKDSTADYYQNKRIICPICGRKAWHVYLDTIVGFVELKEMTFERFGSLDDGAKGRKIQALFKSRR